LVEKAPSLAFFAFEGGVHKVSSLERGKIDFPLEGFNFVENS